ncbi:MAG: hypothetical protein BMS9Abin37_2802 [Acidobacteriota bacterium]|nr:MAG: hypothetical protein BMS9Abin37_2802 [Acidobacteriota bacterium]
MRIGDANEDGRADVVVNHGDVSVLLGKGNGRFRINRRIAIGESLRAVAVGDASGDSRLDVVSASAASGEVFVMRGRGDGTFEELQRYPVSGASAVAMGWVGVVAPTIVRGTPVELLTKGSADQDGGLRFNRHFYDVADKSGYLLFANAPDYHRSSLPRTNADQSTG